MLCAIGCLRLDSLRNRPGGKGLSVSGFKVLLGK